MVSFLFNRWMLPCRPVRSNAQCRGVWGGWGYIKVRKPKISAGLGVALSEPQSDFKCGGAVPSSRGLWRDLFDAVITDIFAFAG